MSRKKQHNQPEQPQQLEEEEQEEETEETINFPEQTQALKQEALTNQKNRIKSLLHKHKHWYGIKTALRPHKEPIILLGRRNNHIEIYENQVKDHFVFIHSSGKTARIQLGPGFLTKMDYAGTTISTYVLDEDTAYPIIPHKPVLGAEMVQCGIEKTLHDRKLLDAQAKLEEIKGGNKAYLIMIIAIAIVVIIIALGIYGGDIIGMFSKAPATAAIAATGPPTIIGP